MDCTRADPHLSLKDLFGNGDVAELILTLAIRRKNGQVSCSDLLGLSVVSKQFRELVLGMGASHAVRDMMRDQRFALSASISWHLGRLSDHPWVLWHKQVRNVHACHADSWGADDVNRVIRGAIPGLCDLKFASDTPQNHVQLLPESVERMFIRCVGMQDPKLEFGSSVTSATVITCVDAPLTLYAPELKKLVIVGHSRDPHRRAPGHPMTIAAPLTDLHFKEVLLPPPFGLFRAGCFGSLKRLMIERGCIGPGFARSIASLPDLRVLQILNCDILPGADAVLARLSRPLDLLDIRGTTGFSWGVLVGMRPKILHVEFPKLMEALAYDFAPGSVTSASPPDF